MINVSKKNTKFNQKLFTPNTIPTTIIAIKNTTQNKQQLFKYDNYYFNHNYFLFVELFSALLASIKLLLALITLFFDVSI